MTRNERKVKNVQQFLLPKKHSRIAAFQNINPEKGPPIDACHRSQSVMSRKNCACSALVFVLQGVEQSDLCVRCVFGSPLLWL